MAHANSSKRLATIFMSSTLEVLRRAVELVFCACVKWLGRGDCYTEAEFVAWRKSMGTFAVGLDGRRRFVPEKMR
jgi:hypothetical protein